MASSSHLKYADIHQHLTLKPFLNTTNGSYSSIWKYTRTSYWARSGKARTSMENNIEGQVKIIFPALGYIEKGWQVVNTLRFKLPAIFRNVGDMIVFLMNVNIAEIDDYYDLLRREMDYLLAQSKPPIDVKPELKGYELVYPHSQEEFDKALVDNFKVIVMPTIEGGNSLISGTVSFDKPNVDAVRVLQNVMQIKQHVLRPFFITFTHHFFNGLAGHARSLYKMGSYFNQYFGLGNPISPDGWRIIKCLLGVDNECGSWPMLIDTKHFSLASRRQYYDYISEELDYSFPVINSHAAYSGSLTIENVIYSNPPFSHNQTNISAEEVYHIWRSGGLVGINFDQNVLWAGPHIPDAHIIRENVTGMVQGALEYAKAKGLPEPDQTIWDIFCIGSDFDGFIDPLNSYGSPLQFPELETKLTEAFAESNQLKQMDIAIAPEDIVRKIMQDNVPRFMSLYYSLLK